MSPTIRRSITVPVAATSLVAALVLTAAPALGHHSVTLTHEPPPGAVASQPLALVVGIHGSCVLFGCGSIHLTLEYASDAQSEPTRSTLRVRSTAKSATFTVPAADVQRGLSYSITATQEGGWSTHQTMTRWPHQGRHRVIVTNARSLTSDLGDVTSEFQHDVEAAAVRVRLPREVTQPVRSGSRRVAERIRRNGETVPTTVGRTVDSVVSRTGGGTVQPLNLTRPVRGLHDRACELARRSLERCPVISPVTD